jgi:putative methyltransferase (TIGR04325 family)
MRKQPGWRQWARRLLPPILVDLVRPAAPAPSKITWSGVYPTRADVPAQRDSYEMELVDDMVGHTRAAYAGLPGAVPLWHETFVVVAGLLASRRRSITVIDYGGGVGSAFVQLIASLPRDIEVRYTVVETPQVCDAGRRLFRDEPRIAFATELPAGATADLVYANGVLQYLDDYPSALRALAAIGAPQILFSRLYAWKGPRFATAQVNLPGRTFANWFFDVSEINEILAACGYREATDCVSEKRYKTDFPPTHAVDCLRTMLFTRESVSSS